MSQMSEVNMPLSIDGESMINQVKVINTMI